MKAERRLRFNVVDGDLNVLVECLGVGELSPARAILVGGGEDMLFVAEEGSIMVTGLLLDDCSSIIVAGLFVRRVDQYREFFMTSRGCLNSMANGRCSHARHIITEEELGIPRT